MGQFVGTIMIEPAGGKLWRTCEPLAYITDKDEKIDIPIGFEFDGASVPKIAWSIVGHPLDQDYLASACVHDYLYFAQPLSRRKADKIMLEAMKMLGVSWWRRRTAYWAVRLFGWIPWKKYKKRVNCK